MKKTLGFFIGGILAVIAGLFGYNQLNDFGSSFIPGYHIIVGSNNNCVPVPINTYVLADSTTTADTTYSVGSNYINQVIKTEGIEEGLLCYKALAANSTTTLSILQMGSYDGTNYANVGSSTDSTFGTSTDNFIPKVPLSIDPGTATTTLKCKNINVKGYNYTRFMPMAEDVAADPGDGGLQAFIYFIPFDEITR